MPSNTEIANFFTPITNQIDGASYVCLNINGSSLSTPNVIQPYVTVNNRGGQPAMFVKIFGLKEFVTANAPSGGSYVLPIASSTVLGGIKVGTGLSIAGDGTLSATGGGIGTVTSVSGLSPLFTVTNPTTTPTFVQISQAPNLVFASPNGSSGNPVFRALVASDIPSLSYVTSVGVSMPSAFNVASSPITGAGTIAITGAGTTAQYIRGDGTLATYNPSAGGGGASQVFYFNGGTPSTVVGYEQMSVIANTGASADFSISADGYIASFLTDVGAPNQLNIPAGNWNFEIYFSSSSAGGSPRFYVELYKYDGSFTLISSSVANPEYITNGTAVDLYTTALSVPATPLLATDRLAVRVYVIHSGKTITMHTQDSNLSEVITTFSTGITALNGLTAQVQTFGNDTNVTMVSSGTIHTLTWVGTLADARIASASDWNTAYTNRITSATTPLNITSNVISIGQATASTNGYLSSTDWTTFNSKANALSGTINTIAYWDSATTIASLALATYPSLTELSYVKGVTSAIQTQIDTINIIITTAISITTNTLDANSASQNGHNVMISNGANAINVSCETSSTANFCASYTKLGSGAITFIAGSGATLTTVDGTAVLNGAVGSTACLTRTGNIYYLQISNR